MIPVFKLGSTELVLGTCFLSSKSAVLNLFLVHASCLQSWQYWTCTWYMLPVFKVGSTELVLGTCFLSSKLAVLNLFLVQEFCNMPRAPAAGVPFLPLNITAITPAKQMTNFPNISRDLNNHVTSQELYVICGIRKSTAVLIWIHRQGSRPVHTLTLQPLLFYLCGIEVKPSPLLKNDVFWDVTPCGSCKNDVSEEPSASFIKVTRIGELGTTLAATSNRRKLRRNTNEGGARFLRNVGSFKSHTA
jgi:hypothetical protein